MGIASRRIQRSLFPLKWFELSTKAMSDQARRRFYCDNFADLVGSGVNSTGHGRLKV